ncbi:hypothetical protein FF011L_48500 [Roseimaritima multifibrata]|uniref:Uncharacterized protein n=1 Tax=Roseimaritima multifibrata TaxID=1930274 RepID=A0A517MMD5_9BACT|nr:hypothetical protein [Roseimaritima multifibrata]QDS96046.1 hypothetical protein FF011L_48500 [Roseimaritima multifibrata]
MNDIQSSRALLLEQLESRCMLAAGVFEQTLDHHGRQPANTQNRPAIVDVQARGTNDSSNGRPDNDLQHGFQPNRDGSHSEGRPAHFSSASGSDTNNPQQIQTPIQVTITPSVVSPDSNASATQSDSFKQPQGGDTTFLGPSTPSTETSSPVTSLAIAPGVETSGAESTANDSNQIVDATGQATGTTADTNAPASNVPVTEELPQALSVVPSESRTTERSELDTSAGGIIESVPLLRRELHLNPESDEGEPWRVDPQSLQRLQEVTRKLDDSLETENPPANDAVIAAWFNNSTGLMEVERYGALGTPTDLSDSIVDVVLNATVGLHRSVDLIAVTPDASEIPDDVRSAILAAIAAEQQPILSAPLNTPGSLRLSAIAYPGAALLVAGAALAARRKRSSGKTESTTDTPPPL